jgi:type 2 lantibiotic biosynthesis protein LanM
MGGPDLLERRLAPASSDDLRPFLGESASFKPGPGIPDWALTLHLVFEEALRSRSGRCFDKDDVHAKDSGRPLPFEEVLQPFIAIARERLRNAAGFTLAVLGPSARRALDRQLLAHLSFVANLTLAEDFSHFRFQRAPVFAFEALWNQTETSTELYDAYVAQLLGAGLTQLMGRRPVLARLLGQSVNQWVSATSNLCHRFAVDFSLLKETFRWGCSSSDSAIEMVHTDLSDRHSGGQTVAELVLSCSSRVIYKPRTVRTEEVFYRFLSQLSSERLSLPLRILKVIDRCNYGWCEVAVPSACSSLEGVARFYYRAGMLLAVLHLLAITDIHCENIIASGEHPVVVDLETMMNAWVPASGSSPWNVLNTGFLPRWQTAPDGHRFDLSGLAADGTQDAGIRRRSWLRVNSDQMHLSDPLSVSASMRHRPLFEHITPSVQDYSVALIAGFEEMYTHLMHCRDSLLSNQAVLGMFDDLESRVLLRGTASYTHMQLRLLHPEFMASGIDRSIELEWLARPLSGPVSHKCDRRRIYEHERDPMEKLDVPTFTTAFAGLASDEGSDPDLAFLRARRDASFVRERLAQLNLADCNRQVELIKQAIRDRFPPAV